MTKFINSIILIVIILLIDQFSKTYVKTNFYYGESYAVTDWFRLTFIENEGMAWGTKIPGEYGKLFLTLFRIIAVGGIGYWLWDSAIREKSNYLIAAVAFIFAGAMGNIIDSIIYGVMFDESTTTHLATYFPENHYGTWFHGRVVDMFDFPIWEGYLPDWVPFVEKGEKVRFFNAIFNFADFSISIGVGILIFFNKKAFTLPKDSISRVFSNKLD